MNTNQTTHQEFCSKCGSRRQIGSQFCMSCGARFRDNINSQPNYVFCPSCGSRYKADAVYCENCGANMRQGQPRATQYQPPYQTTINIQYPNSNLTFGISQQIAGTLSKKEKSTGTIWLVATIFKAIIAVLCFFAGVVELLEWDDPTYLVVSFVLMLIWVVPGAIFAYSAFQRSKRALSPYAGMVNDYKNHMAGYIVALVYSLFLGGIIDIAAAIYGLTVRDYVIKNQSSLGG